MNISLSKWSGGTWIIVASTPWPLREQSNPSWHMCVYIVLEHSIAHFFTLFSSQWRCDAGSDGLISTRVKNDNNKKTRTCFRSVEVKKRGRTAAGIKQNRKSSTPNKCLFTINRKIFCFCSLPPWVMLCAEFCLPETYFHKVSGHVICLFPCLHRCIPLMHRQMH